MNDDRSADVQRAVRLLGVMTFPPDWEVSIDEALTFAGPVAELRIEAKLPGGDTGYCAYAVIPPRTPDGVVLGIIQRKAHEVAAAMIDRQITVDGVPLSRVKPRVVW